MSRLNDRLTGYLILVGSLLGIAGYFYLVFLSPWIMLIIQVSAFAAVTAMLAIVAWMGYMLATTPPPMPLKDFDEESSKDEEKEENAQI